MIEEVTPVGGAREMSADEPVADRRAADGQLADRPVADLPDERPADGAPRPPRHRVDPRARWYWFLSGGLTLLGVVLAAGVPALLLPDERTWILAVGGVGALAALPYATLAPVLRYRTHRWEATSTAVYSRTGWIGRQWRIAPLSRVQTVEAKRNPLHRALGLAAVSVTTGSAQGAVVIQGLDAQVAEELVTTLTVAVARTRGDAT